MIMYYVIYKITNKINGKFYIGSHKTNDLNDSYMGSGKYLRRSQEKYGLENFSKEILFCFDTPELMYAKEAEIVNEDFLATENTYNLKRGGFGGWDYNNTEEGQKLREFSYERWRESGTNAFCQKLKEDEEFRKKHLIHLNKVSEIAKIKQKEKYPNGTFFNKKHSDITKAKIGKATSIAQRGDGNSQFGTMWITDGSESKKISKTDVIPDGWKKGRIMKK